MATTPTKDDIPSEKPVNLKFNAGKLDEEVNSDALTYKDRFDVERLTNAGRNAFFAESQSQRESDFSASQEDKESRFQQFLLSSGYVFLGDYELGPWQFSERNQFIRYDGQYWKLAATAPDDFATTGITMQSFEVDKLNLALIEGDTIRQELAASDGYQHIGQAKSFAALRTITPGHAGQRIILASWNESPDTVQWSYGGGEFIAVNANGVDDGGCIARVNSTWYWKRVIKLEDLTVDHFGGIPDGTTDVQPAALRMHNFSRTSAPQLGIVLGVGLYYWGTDWDISSTAIDYFRLAGQKTSDFGYFNLTRLILRKGSGVSITVKARFVDLSNFIVNGQKNITPNTQGLFKNTITQGQYFRSNGLRSLNMGGKTIQLVDTLDTKIDQFYVQGCSASFLKVTFSNEQSWNHSTAIELSNFNAQSCTSEVIFDCVKATQSIMRNGWIEHCENPGNISDGDWVIDNLSMEYCTNKMLAQNCKLIQTQTNLQGTSGFDYTTGSSNASYGSYEIGRLNIRNNAMSLLGGSSAQYETTMHRLPSAGTARWVLVGHVYLPSIGQQAIMEIHGADGFNPAAASSNSPLSAMGGGKCVITMQHKDTTDNFTVSWYREGNSAILDVMYTQPYKNDFYIYVQVAAYSYSVGTFIYTTGTNRLESGIHFYFDPSLSVVSDITAVTGIKSAPALWSINNAVNGLGMDLDRGYLLYKGASDAGNLKIPIMVNGVLRYLSVTSS